ncbi:aldo/keto reductase [Vibrio nitrifigilis]|uniref:Aldo/keto reductase n=1 Tax=Vibrio nitrifigilis TaxID=2789781 RepID=A0ABS0GDE9_9VIBR|nr:aldo/keto reductase [Vibrio nitrifigilis]MBF9000395.1 aldo/keto reductase [Vibrio nitrifigilis]
MKTTALGTTGLDIVPLVFGGNVFGWTIDEKTSFDILDCFIDQGFNAIDTADVYSSWAPGNKGGESETIIGNWLAARPGMRDKIKLFTKVGSDLEQPGKKGLSKRWIIQAIDESLARLKTDYVDLYFSHWPDEGTPYEETLRAYEQLLKEGKIRSVGASNLNAAQLGETVNVAKANNLPTYQVLQPEYNLYDRDGFNPELQALCLKENIGVVTYYSLASGFLSGKYRSTDDLKKSARGEGIAKYLDAKGQAILKALDTIAEAHNAEPAQVAIAWLIAQDAVTAPIASATKRSHIENFRKAVDLKLSNEEIAILTKAGQA